MIPQQEQRTDCVVESFEELPVEHVPALLKVGTHSDDLLIAEDAQVVRHGRA